MNNLECPKCTCGEPWTEGVIHRSDAPCYWPPRDATPPQEEPLGLSGPGLKYSEIEITEDERQNAIKALRSQEEPWVAEFDRELTISHPGDSGIGGNDPQEPTYQMAADPEDVKVFIQKTLEADRKERAGVVLDALKRKKKVSEIDERGRHMEDHREYNAIIDEVAEIIKDVMK